MIRAGRGIGLGAGLFVAAMVTASLIEDRNGSGVLHVIPVELVANKGRLEGWHGMTRCGGICYCQAAQR